MQNHLMSQFRAWPIAAVVACWLSGFTATDVSASDAWRPTVGAPAAPHRILKSPAAVGSPAAGSRHLGHAPHAPAIPAAVVEPRWKTPYAYGYFGAQPKKQWTRSYGYRDVYQRWTYR